MFSYQAYGLGIHSEFKLFQLLTVDIEQDVLIRKDQLNIGTINGQFVNSYLRLSPEESILFFEGIGKFLVREGHEIIVEPAPGVNQILLQRFLVGAVMATLLYQRGKLVLHGSAVSLNGQGVLFLGGPGAGKSSLAATHLSHGHLFVVDDVAAIEIENGFAWIYPGFPQIKLGDEIANLVTRDNDQYVLMDDLEDKQHFRINFGMCQEKVPLRTIYVLKGDDHVQINGLTKREAIIELIRYSIPTSVVKLTATRHFEQCFGLIQEVNVYSLHRSNTLTDLHQLVNLVELNS